MTSPAFDMRLPLRWRRPVLIAVSVVAHILILWAIASRTSYLAPVSAGQVLVYFDIEPRELLPDETPRTHPAAAAPAQQSVAVQNSDIRSPLSMHDPRLDDEDETLLNPHSAAQSPGAPADSSEVSWLYQPETMRGAVARSLRTSPIGCDMRNGRMSAAEQQLCDDRFNERAGRARPINATNNPERDARFAREGAAAIDRYERRRRPLAGGTGVVGPADCAGSNFGTGCAGSHIDPSLQPDSTQNIRTPQRDGPR